MNPQINIGKYTYYEQDLIGRGSYGQVYKGHYKSNNEQLVAIKKIDLNQINRINKFSTEEQNKGVINKEIEIMQQLQSNPYLVQFLETIEIDNFVYIIIEYCDEGDLRNYIQINNQIDEIHCIQIIKQVVKGMEQLITQSFVHRDLKPENILIKNQNFKIADFGMATKFDIKKQQLMKDFVGTPLYMSPQIIKSEEYSSKSDVWSLGLIFYELLFGRTPWPCRDIQSLLRNIDNTPLRFPYNIQISTITKKFIAKTLEIQECDRLSWDQIFVHPLFQEEDIQSQIQYEFPCVSLDSISRNIFNNLQNVLQCFNLNIKQIFNKFDTNSDGILDKDEFHVFLEQIDQRITSFESDHLFKKLDTSKDGFISFDEFIQLFNKYDFADLKDMGSFIINEVREIIKTYGINIENIFKEIDLDGGGSLDLQEFTLFLKKIAPCLKQYDIQQVFDKFDENQDGKLSLFEFEQTLLRGVKGEEYRYDLNMEKIIKLINEMKFIIYKQNLSLQKIFKTYDNKNQNIITYQALKKLMKTLDHRLNNEQIQIAFQYFDKNQDDIIDFQDFQNTLL